ncbi:hypothetical protein SNOG_02126 [Parastagonospora nodorum SN15]|uniref:Uncharacterized protein n=1 Tax=Phaeosphaeria nodorum (strain SN15 / ATCC MYA-4574 / FGSC 10173) TaxID=321614 RepID=Q0V1I8_PHANO|nr:hypothetical protein SNOG_02126 [Parastagonospora nodorum SN15]EAT90338.1 hypothetical protein SNOG_02126 [Parastagonospora nodorum SN15]
MDAAAGWGPRKLIIVRMHKEGGVALGSCLDWSASTPASPIF